MGTWEALGTSAWVRPSSRWPCRGIIESVPVELILAGNGPGELSGWVAPVARAARHAVPDLRLTLALSPSQFAGGRELQVVRNWNLFDRILEPRACLRAAAGLEALPVAERATLIHLGGDLWLSGRLASRMHRPACALVETTLVVRRHQMFSRVFASSADVATALAAGGVPPEKIITTGDPRVDAVWETILPDPSTAPRSSEIPTVSILPSSRDRVFTIAVPYFLSAGAALRIHSEAVRFNMIVSPYVSSSVWMGAREEATRRWPHLDIEWVTGESWAAVAASDLVITIPGTNTLELAILGVPFVVVVDTDLVTVASLEGLLEWATRAPGLRRLRRALLLRRLSRVRFAALPNIRAGREIVPELIGRWTPEELAKQVAALLRSPARRHAIRRALRDTFTQPPGASRAIVDAALALARNGLTTQ